MKEKQEARRRTASNIDHFKVFPQAEWGQFLKNDFVCIENQVPQVEEECENGRRTASGGLQVGVTAL